MPSGTAVAHHAVAVRLVWLHSGVLQGRER